MLIPLEGGSEKKVFFKRYKQRDWKDALKYFFFSSKAKSEWKAINNFLKKGIPVSFPLAFGEERKFGILKDSCLITEAISNSSHLNHFYKNFFQRKLSKDEILFKRALLKRLARLVYAIHSKGIFYRDLHGGNILLEEDTKGEIKFVFIDLHKARFFNPLFLWMKVYDLAHLFYTLSPKRTDSIRFLREYAKDDPQFTSNFEKNMHKIENKALKLKYRHLKSRTKRCLILSSGFFVKKVQTQRIYTRREYEKKLDLLKEAITNSKNQNLNILQETKKSKIFWLSLFNDHNEKKLCIKKDKYQGFLSLLKNLFRKSRAKRSWIGANGFYVREISTPKSIAFFENKWGWVTKESFFINEYLPNAERLNLYVLKTFKESFTPSLKKRIREFVKKLAEKIRELHEKGIYHADLKSDNILVREKDDWDWEFFFVDLDRVTFKKKLSFKKRINNLAQINASVADCINVSDRLRFFWEYAKGSPLFSQRKRYYRNIIEIGKKKNTPPYGLTFSAK
jgi:serine/threonine protein kinase